MKYTQHVVTLFLAMTITAASRADEPPAANTAPAAATTTEADPAAEPMVVAKRPERKVAPLKDQMEAALKRLKPVLDGKKIMTAAVPHYANKPEHWPAAPAVLDQMLILLEEHEHEVPARVESLVLGPDAVPPKSLIDDLQSQFPFDLLMTADYRRNEQEIDVTLRIFDAKTRKRIHHETLDLGNDLDALGYAPNRKVWEYCHEMKGYMVGNGECWTLAASALAEKELQHPYALQYGRAVPADGLLIPGDLLQIEGVSIQGADGWYISMGHHTAIVHNNLGGGMIELIHQNGPPLGRYVCLLPVNMYAYSGSIAPYRPLEYETPETEEMTTAQAGQ